jgi:hypothetical protein
MPHTTAPRARVWRTVASAAAALLLVAGVHVSCLWAEGESVSIVGVEEHWELVVAQPDSDLDAPQVTAVISPFGHLNGLHAAFELNHQSQPSFSGGGLQLQVWNGGEAPAATQKQKNGESLAQANETITWIQKMDLADGQLVFDVDDGNSQSWGSFGQGLWAAVPTTLTNLNAYNPLVSVNASGVGFASNRVTSLKLKTVKVRLSSGQVLVDSTEKVAYPKQ